MRVAQFVCRYRKDEQVRWISHLDVKRTLERALRRAGLPLALTQGHNPRAKLSFGPPLPLGATGEGELLTLHLKEAMDPGDLKDRLRAKLPPGLEMVEIWHVPAYRKKETLGDIDVAEYEVKVRGVVGTDELEARIEQLMHETELVVVRGGERPERTVDIRPHLLNLEARELAGGDVALDMRLRTGSHGGARPQEVVALLGLDEEHVIRYHRARLYASAKAAAPARRGLRRRWRQARS